MIRALNLFISSCREHHVTHHNRLATAKQMIAHYNAQDADGYVSLMTDEACEADYRGTVLRAGREGVRRGLQKIFAEFPQNRAEIRDGWQIGETAILLETVRRTPQSKPIEVMSIYTFDGDHCSRVEFIR